MGGPFKPHSTRHRLTVGFALLGVTLVGVLVFLNWFSFLMLVCLGVPGLLVIVDAFLNPAA